MAHTLSYSDYSYSSHDESQTEGENDSLQWRQRQGTILSVFTLRSMSFDHANRPTNGTADRHAR